MNYIYNYKNTAIYQHLQNKFCFKLIQKRYQKVSCLINGFKLVKKILKTNCLR
jgi:hypothetical protein